MQRLSARDAGAAIVPGEDARVGDESPLPCGCGCHLEILRSGLRLIRLPYWSYKRKAKKLEKLEELRHQRNNTKFREY